MRTRAAAASVAVALLTLLGSVACSAPSDDAPPSHSEEFKKGARQQQASRNGPAVDPSTCAIPSGELPEECEVHPSFAATHEAVPAETMPTPGS